MTEERNTHKDCPHCGGNNYESNGLTSTTYTCLECGKTAEVGEINKSLISEDTKEKIGGFVKEIAGIESPEIKVGVDDDRDPDMCYVEDMNQTEIDERIKQMNSYLGGSIPTGIVGGIFATTAVFAVSLGITIVGVILSATVIGVLIGAPMALIGTIGMVASPIVGLLMVTSETFGEDPWNYTGLNGDDQKQDREWNLAFDAQCAVCGKYFTLRDTTEEVTRETATCIECGAVYEKEDTFNWRLIEGDSEHLGESKRTGEWNNIAEKNKVLEA